ncbi:MAG: VWA domain-containing protein [Acidobacteria bacterium]|nr:VWA domain-containing protein [Acidobacteriota bacterium]
MTRRMVVPAIVVATLGSSASAPVTAQTPAPQVKPFTLEVEVDVVSVTAVVFDKKGHFVRDLGPEDIALYEDGVLQKVEYFREASSDEAERIPLTVVLALDTSGSMNQSMRFLQEAVLNFVYKLEDVDTAMVVSFNDSVKGSAEFTGDLDRLERFVEGLQAWGGTSLYDAIQYSLNRIRDQPGRKAVIVFSDGADTTSSMRDRDVVDYARAVEATVYCIGFKGSGPGGSPRGFLKKIASETGGEFFSPGDIGDLIQVFNAISDELKNHYLLAYTPTREADGSWREIKLEVNRPDTKVRVRKGYFHIKRRRTSG